MNGTSPDLIKDAIVHQQLNERHLSYRELFRQLDKDHDGRIDVDQLITLLEKGGIETSAKKRWDIVRRIIAQAGGSPDASSLSFKEFANYVFQQENKLSLAFRTLDANRHGKFDAKDLVYYFRKFRIKLDLEEAEKLVEKNETRQLSRNLV